MASAVNYGLSVEDRGARNALQIAAAEISALSGHVAAFQATINVAAAITTTDVANTVNGILAKLVVAGLMNPS
jgi:hypothetical protein